MVEIIEASGGNGVLDPSATFVLPMAAAVSSCTLPGAVVVWGGGKDRVPGKSWDQGARPVTPNRGRLRSSWACSCLSTAWMFWSTWPTRGWIECLCARGGDTYEADLELIMEASNTMGEDSEGISCSLSVVLRLDGVISLAELVCVRSCDSK